MLRHKSLVALAVLALALSPALSALDLEEHFFDSDGVKIRYIVQGQGDPVVLIHGFTASVEANWIMPGILNKLAESFQVIALDARGHGKSDKPHDPAAYGDHMVDDVIRLLDHLGIEKAHIGGYSMGGFLTMRILATHPERMLSAIIGAAGWAEVKLIDGGDHMTTLMNPELSSQFAEGVLEFLIATCKCA